MGKVKFMKILKAQFISSAHTIAQLKPHLPRQIAFLGRSNVGKSSLINSILERKNLVQTSKSPGKTKSVNYFEVQIPKGTLTLVDVPGYGYAEVPLAMRQQWEDLLQAFFAAHDQISHLFILVDVRRDFTDVEDELWQILDEHKISWSIILTKCDKLKGNNEKAARLKALRSQILHQDFEFILSSSLDHQGRDEIWDQILFKCFGVALPTKAPAKVKKSHGFVPQNKS